MERRPPAGHLLQFDDERSAGHPKPLFNLSNSYDDALQQRHQQGPLLQAGVEPVANLTLNHRDCSAGLADVRNPARGPWAACRTDEAFSRPESGLAATASGTRGAREESVPYRAGGTYN